MKKCVVVLADKYYPDMSAPSAVIDKYIQILKRDYNIHVVTITYRNGFKPFEDSRIGVSYVTSWWHEARIAAEETFKAHPDNKLAWLRIQLFRARSLVMSYFCYPLSTKWEIKGYYNELNRLSKEMKIDAIISVSNTIITQFAARKYKKENPQVKWLTFFTDPFTYHYIYYPPYYPFRKLREKRNYKNQLDIYNKADYNLLTEELYDIALEKFKPQKSKTYQIKYVLQDIGEGVAPTVKPDDERIKMVYAGALYKTVRNPEYMLAVISKTEGISLDLFTSATTGNECGDIIERYLGDRIHAYPPKDRAAYLEMICNEYDILVNIGNNSSNQTPSKTLELLSTGRPILNFYYSKDSQYEMIEQYPLGLNVGREDEDAIEMVQNFCMRMKGKRMSFEEVEALYPENTIDKQIALLKRLLDK